MTRRRAMILGLLVLFASAFGWLVAGAIVDTLGGAFAGPPARLDQALSPGARDLIEDAYQGVEPARLFDYHTHVVGVGTGGTGTWINEGMASWSNPVKRAKFSIYLSASGVTDLTRTDQQFVERLVDLVRNNPRHGKHAIMAFDQRYTEDGKPDPEHTEFYVPNDYIFRLADEYPDLFVPVMSIHPLRPEAISELQKWARKGGHFMKWLPNAMGITPDDERLDPFYDEMRRLDVVLISHTGEEQAVDAEQDQERGNPLRLRGPLDRGVKVIAAHCASLGTSEDLDEASRAQTDNIDLLLRLFADSKYEQLLFADISAMTQWNRAGRPLRLMLEHTEFHGRLVNGSDYPLPAINALVSTRHLAQEGFITEAEREYLNEIYAYNPLLFDYVTKRTLHVSREGQTEPARFPIDLFTRRDGL